MNTTFWQGRRVFLTGHTGFKGSWLSLWLQRLGAEVTGYALPPQTIPDMFTLAGIAAGMESIIADIRDLETLQSALSNSRAEIVIHMAAQPLVRYSYANPVETYSTNVMGTVNLLEAVRHTPSVKAVINVTSDKCYENQEWVWGYRENEPMGGHDPYSNSKGCAELVTQAYRKSFFHTDTSAKIASARAGNVIGGGDWAEDRLIPDIMRACMGNQTIIIRNPHAIRPWQHVLEPLSGYLSLAQKLFEQGSVFAEAWNFGPLDSETRTVEWIVQQLTNQWGNQAHYSVQSDEMAPHEARYLKLDCSKASQLLNWHPRWTLSHTLKMTTEWYKAYAEKEDLREVTYKQISAYEASTMI